MRRPGILITILFFFCFQVSYSQVQPAGIFGDHMVLQQGMPLPVCGTVRIKIFGDKVIYSGPVFDRISIEGNGIRVQFKYGDGMMAKGDSLTGFAIAGLPASPFRSDTDN